MAGSITVRKLITKWGFDVDQAPLDQMDRSIANTKKHAAKLTKGLAAVGGAIAGIVKSSDRLAELKATMRAITRDGEHMANQWERLTNFAEGTPFSVDQTVNAYVKMRDMGVKATDELLKSMGDMASASGRQLDSMTLALQRATQGMFRRLKGFGFGVERMGDKVKLEYQGMTRTIDGDDKDQAVNAFKELTQASTAMGSMEQRMKQVGPAFIALTDQIKLLFVSLQEASAMQSTFVPIISKVSEALKSARGGADSLAATLGNALTFAAAAAIAPFATIGTLLWSVLDVISALIPGMDALELGIWAVTIAFTAWMSVQLGLFLKSFITLIISSTQVLWGKVAALTAAKVASVAMWAGLLLGAIAVIAILQDIATWFRGGDSMFGEFLKKGAKVWKAFKGMAWAAIVWIGMQFKSAWNSVVASGKSIIGGIFTWIRKKWNETIGFITDKASSISSSLDFLPGIGGESKVEKKLAVSGAQAQTARETIKNNQSAQYSFRGGKIEVRQRRGENGRQFARRTVEEQRTQFGRQMREADDAFSGGTSQ